MDTLQAYAVFGLPIVALVAASVALIAVRRGAARVERADLHVQRMISVRRKQFDDLASAGITGLSGKAEVEEAKADVVRIRWMS